ncbi:MAG: tetratricopeptide repeat protein, partial [Myxococcota bacterium]
MRYALAMALFVVSLSPVALFAQGGAPQEAKLDRAERQLTELETRYVRPELMRKSFKLETRYNDAKVAYALGDYDKASTLFLDVATRADQGFTAYRETLYLLADSLRASRNFVGARNYARQLIGLGPGPFRQEALKLVLDISYETGNYDGVDDVYDMMDEQGQSSANPALDYLRGKTLLNQEKYEEARRYFERAARDEKLSSRARYLSAVTLVSQEKYDEAINGFLAVSKLEPKTPEDRRLINLAHLSLGRVHYETDKYPEAFDYYSRLPRNDPDFIKAVYEATWTLVQQKKYKEAKRNTDVILVADPSPDMYTKTMLLRADIALRISDYDDALESYESVVELYEPVKLQIEAFVAEHEDLRGFFRGLVRDDLTLQTPEGLPTITTEFVKKSPGEWLAEGSLMKKTTLTLEDVATSRNTIAQSLAALDELEARLTSGSRVKSFAQIADAYRIALAVEQDLFEVRRALLDVQAKALVPKLSGRDAEQWRALAAERTKYEKMMASVPKDAKQLDARGKSVDEDFEKMRRRLDDLGYAIDSLRAELTAVETYMQTQQVVLSEEAAAQVSKLKSELRATLVELEQEREGLRAEVDRTRQRIGVGDVVSDNERALFELYRETLARQAQLLALHEAKAGGALAEIQRTRARL